MVDEYTINRGTYTDPAGSSILSTFLSFFPPNWGLRSPTSGSGVKKPVPVATGPTVFKVESRVLKASGGLRGGKISSISSGVVPRNWVHNDFSMKWITISNLRHTILRTLPTRMGTEQAPGDS